MTTDGMKSADADAVRSVRWQFVRNLRVVGLATLLSRLLGMCRDIAMATLFGASTTLDVFIVAFRLPNLTRQLFGEGALTTAFLPVFLREKREHGLEAARATLTAVAIALATTLSLIVVLSEGVILWGLSTMDLSPATTLLLQLLAILLPYMIFICSAALLSSALHAFEVFLWPALVPVVLNVIWLTGAVVATLMLESESDRIRLIACLITGAGIMQCLLPLFILQRLGIGLSRSWKVGWPRVYEVIQAMLPVVAGITVMQLNVVIDSLMAWSLAIPDGGGSAPIEAWGIDGFLPPGTATELYIGQRMYQFPLGVFGIALGTVIYPLLTRHAQAGDLDRLRSDLSKSIRLVITIGLPASAGLWIISQPLIRFLFQHGAFTSSDSSNTAEIIAVYGLGVWAYIGLTVINRAFYALEDRITPMKLGLLALTFNIFLNVTLVRPLLGIGLALASVLAAVLQLVLTTWKLQSRLSGLHWNEILVTTAKTLAATLVMLFTCNLIAWKTPPHNNTTIDAWQLGLTFVAGVMSFGMAAKLLKMTEVNELLHRDSAK